MTLSNDTNNSAVLAVCKNFTLTQRFQLQETLCCTENQFSGNYLLSFGYTCAFLYVYDLSYISEAQVDVGSFTEKSTMT